MVFTGRDPGRSRCSTSIQEDLNNLDEAAKQKLPWVIKKAAAGRLTRQPQAELHQWVWLSHRIMAFTSFTVGPIHRQF